MCNIIFLSIVSLRKSNKCKNKNKYDDSSMIMRRYYYNMLVKHLKIFCSYSFAVIKVSECKNKKNKKNSSSCKGHKCWK